MYLRPKYTVPDKKYASIKNEMWKEKTLGEINCS